MTVLDAQQIEAFWDAGSITVPNAVTADQLRLLITEFESWVEESRKHPVPFGEMLDGRARFDVEPGHCAERPALRRIAAPTDLSANYLQVLRDSAMTDMVADLIGPNLRLHHTKINSKLPGAATEVKWHQDFTFDPHSNDDMITALLFLDDVSEDNGSLQIAPGTHRGPLLSLWQNGRFTGAVSEQDARDLDRQARTETGAAGSVCLMHVRVVHGSKPNRSSHPRTLFIAAIAAADAVPLAANPIPSRHEGMLLRGKEPGRIRSMAFDLETPEVPAGASFFEQQATDIR